MKEKLKKEIKEYLSSYANDDLIDDFFNKYDEPWRHYHNLNHVSSLISDIDSLLKNSMIDEEMYEALYLIALFHDSIYFPWNVKTKGKYLLGKSNEELSADYFTKFWQQRYKSELYYLVHDSIIATESHENVNNISEIFNKLDMSIISNSNWNKILEWENNIRKEYSMASTEDYKTGRCHFLDTIINTQQDKSSVLQNLREYVADYKPNVGFYAGSFNPFHIGHLDIVNQAKEIFDKVVILTGQNPFKETSSDFEERKINIFKKTACEVDIIDGYLANYLKKRSEHERVTLIKGFRNSDDIKTELATDRYSKDIWEYIRTIYLPSTPELTHISSSAIRSLEKIEKGSGTKYIPDDLF